MLGDAIAKKWENHFDIGEHIDNNILPRPALLRGYKKICVYFMDHSKDNSDFYRPTIFRDNDDVQRNKIKVLPPTNDN